MKIIKKLIASSLFLLSFLSCTTRETPESQNINFPKKIILNLSEVISDSMNLSDIAEKVEYIPLQTNDSAVLGYIYDFVITKENFFIKDELSILRYDKNGNFINHLFKVGRGPGEAGARGFTVDNIGKLVYVLDHFTGDVKIYDFSGKNINNIKKPIAPLEYRIWSIGYFYNNLFVATTQRPMTKYLYSFFNLKNDSVRILYKNYHNYDKSQENQRPAIIPKDDCYQITDTSLLFKEKFCDTIFEVKQDYSIEPRYIIDLGNRKLEWEGWRDHGMFNIAGGPPYGYWVQSFIETKSYLFIVLKSFKEPELFSMFDKRANSVKIFINKYYERTFTPVYLRNDLDNFMAFPPMNEDGNISFYDGCLYTVIDAKDFAKSYQSVSVKTRNSTKYLKKSAPSFSTITEFSNPIMMKVYLK